MSKNLYEEIKDLLFYKEAELQGLKNALQKIEHLKSYGDTKCQIGFLEGQIYATSVEVVDLKDLLKSDEEELAESEESQRPRLRARARKLIEM